MTHGQLLAYWNETFDPGKTTKDVLIGRAMVERKENWLAIWKRRIKQLWPTR